MGFIMKENLCFYEEEGNLKVCGFFEFLCNLGFDFNNPFFDEKAFFKANKAIIYKELLAWSANSKKLINNLLLASIFKTIDSKKFDEEKNRVIEYVESSQKCMEYFERVADKVFDSEEELAIKDTFLECKDMSLALQSINHFYVVSSVPNRGFNKAYLDLAHEYDKFKKMFNIEIDNIYPSPLGEQNISRLRDLIGSLQTMYDKVANVANVYDNFLFAEKEETETKVNGSLESLINMERSTSITEHDLNEVFYNLIRYSNYLDPNLKIEAQKELRKARFLELGDTKSELIAFSILSMSLAAVLNYENENVQIFISSIISSPIITYILGSGLVSKINSIVDKKYMIGKTLEDEITETSSIQNGESWVNESIRSLKLLDK